MIIYKAKIIGIVAVNCYNLQVIHIFGIVVFVFVVRERVFRLSGAGSLGNESGSIHVVDDGAVATVGRRVLKGLLLLDPAEGLLNRRVEVASEIPALGNGSGVGTVHLDGRKSLTTLHAKALTVLQIGRHKDGSGKRDHKCNGEDHVEKVVKMYFSS